MFVEISPHEGVFISNPPLGKHLQPVTECYRLNLNFIRKVFFEKEDIYRNEIGFISIAELKRKKEEEKSKIPVIRFGNDEETEEINEMEKRYENLKKITLNKIIFEIVLSDGDGYEYVVLSFTEEGHGEYQKFKRIIDENTYR